MSPRCASEDHMHCCSCGHCATDIVCDSCEMSIWRELQATSQAAAETSPFVSADDEDATYWRMW